MRCSFFPLGISDLQELVLKILGSHASPIVLDKEAVLVPLDENLDILGIGIPRIRNGFSKHSREATVETAPQMIQDAQRYRERKLLVCHAVPTAFRCFSRL